MAAMSLSLDSLGNDCKPRIHSIEEWLSKKNIYHKQYDPILGFHSFLREYNDKDMATMLVYLTIDANEKSFVNGTPTWRR
jgi:hypothetical protein